MRPRKARPEESHFYECGQTGRFLLIGRFNRYGVQPACASFLSARGVASAAGGIELHGENAHLVLIAGLQQALTYNDIYSMECKPIIFPSVS